MNVIESDFAKFDAIAALPLPGLSQDEEDDLEWQEFIGLGVRADLDHLPAAPSGARWHRAPVMLGY